VRLYREFSPTQFDCKGLALPDRQDWIVAPVSQTRDSEAIDASNFAVTLSQLGGESDTVEMHRFGHWGPGWFEIIIIDPTDTARVAIAEDIESALSDYPVLDDSDVSNREYEAYLADWEHWASHDLAELLQKELGLSDTATYRLWDADVPLREFYEGQLAGETWSENNTLSPMRAAVARCTRAMMARFLRQYRRPSKVGATIGDL